MAESYRKPNHLRGLQERLRVGPMAEIRDTKTRVGVLERAHGGSSGGTRTILLGGGASSGGGGGAGAGVTVGTYATRPAAASASGQFYLATDRANTLYYSDGVSWAVVNPRIHTLQWLVWDGRARADAAAGVGPLRFLPSLDGVPDESVALWKPYRWKMHARGAPAGASLIVQVEYGTTATPSTDLFASGDRPTITAGAQEATGTTFVASAIANGAAFEPVIDQVGSTAGSEGEDITLEIMFTQIDA